MHVRNNAECEGIFRDGDEVNVLINEQNVSHTNDYAMIAMLLSAENENAQDVVFRYRILIKLRCI